jgi:AAA domain
MVDEPKTTLPRFTRDEQAFAVWLSHTVIPVGVAVIAILAYGHVPVGFIVPEVVIWTVFTALIPTFDLPATIVLRLFKRDEYLVDVEALRHRALPSAFAFAFALQFVALTFLLADTGGPITSPFASFVIAYAVFSSLLTTQLWALGVALLVPTVYYSAMVAAYGFGSQSDRASVGVYLAVTLFIIWLTVWLAFLSRLSIWRMHQTIDAEADLATLRAAVATQIWDRGAVPTRSLPARRAAAEAALAEYLHNHPELSLRIREGRRLEWVEQERMARARALATSFTTDAATELLATSLDLGSLETLSLDSSPGDSVAVGSVGDEPILPDRLLIRATSEAPSHELLEETGRIARQKVSGANVAVLLVADATDWLARPAAMNAQRSFVTSVVVLDSQRLLRLAGATAPRRALMGEIREQADLSKANPFVVVGPTPPPMFFGRRDEEASVTALLGDNSAALLGGRRTGKTSLLQRIERRLLGEDWAVLYADLQSVGDWASFAALVSSHWKVDVSADFSPSWIATIVREIRKQRGDRPIVILLDEVDQFLKWDLVHPDPLVPEAFFRACRALSQKGEAQFVLAGERIIANRLWSPDSPHWNFCRPIAVRQLTRKDADRLLVQPLGLLQIRLEDAQRVLDHAWQRTSGHPHLVQYLGGELIGLLNDRDPENRGTLNIGDIAAITDTAEYRNHYISTYRGQGTPLEISLCNLAAAGAMTVSRLNDQLESRRIHQDMESIRAALRMLDLYGILETTDDELVFRSKWMPDALREAGEAGTLDPKLI